MRFELTKWNKDKAAKALGDLSGKSIMISDMHLSGVESIEFEDDVFYDDDPIPEENYDGGRLEYIRIIFNIGNGRVYRHFCPDREICHFWHETDDLICFRIEKIPEYVQREKDALDFKLQEYEKFMSI